MRNSFYVAAGDFHLCCTGRADTQATSAAVRIYVAAVDGYVINDIIRPNPTSIAIANFSEFAYVEASSCRYIATVDGDAAVAPRGNRISASFSHNRAAIDGNAAAVTPDAPNPIVYEEWIPFCRFGADNAAIDGNAAAFPDIGFI